MRLSDTKEASEAQVAVRLTRVELDELGAQGSVERGAELSLGTGFEVEVRQYFHGFVSDDLLEDKESIRDVVVVWIVLHLVRAEVRVLELRRRTVHPLLLLPLRPQGRVYLLGDNQVLPLLEQPLLCELRDCFQVEEHYQ